MTDQPEHRVYAECLSAAAYGPFSPVQEFATLFGRELSEVRAIADSFGPATAIDGEVEIALSAAMNNLLGYPHGLMSVWPDWISIPPLQLERIFTRLRAGRL